KTAESRLGLSGKRCSCGVQEVPVLTEVTFGDVVGTRNAKSDHVQARVRVHLDDVLEAPQARGVPVSAVRLAEGDVNGSRIRSARLGSAVFQVEVEGVEDDLPSRPEVAKAELQRV